VLDRAEVRMDRCVSALAGPDRPGAAGIARCDVQYVARALAVGRSYRVDGRQVQHIEAHRRDPWQLPRRLLERRAARGVGRGGTGEHLVPRAEPGPLAIDA